MKEREGGREGGREEGREGGREGGRERGRVCVCSQYFIFVCVPIQTLSSFSEVQRDLLKHQSLLEVKSNRVKELETLLKETRLAADKEYRKLIEEKEQMKINFLSKLKERDRKYTYI